MQLKNIKEGGLVELDAEYLDLARTIKKNKPQLPFSVKNTAIEFDDYIVGELVLKDLSIKIYPRNNAFSLNTYFQITSYLYDLNQDNLVGTGFEINDGFFTFSKISNYFCCICAKLIQFGLTGTYISRNEDSFRIVGEIDFSNFYTQILPIHGIPQFKSEYSIDTNQNRLIKKALKKLAEFEKYNQNPQKYQILREMSSVGDIEITKQEAVDSITNFYSPNPWYFTAIDLSIKILFDLEVEYSNGRIEWMSYLENSNTLFESYIRKVLLEKLDENITKWPEPHVFGSLRGLKKTGEKLFSPDILLNYSPLTGISEAVIDVKNKSFEPSNMKNLDNLCSTHDIYQIVFYCSQLKSKSGGLVYPSTTSNDPIHLMLDSKSKLNIYLFSMNMNEEFHKRNDKLAKEIYNYLLKRN